MVLGVERPDDLGVRADGRRGLAEWVGVVTGVVGVVLAPDHPLKGVGEFVDIHDTSTNNVFQTKTKKMILFWISKLCMMFFSINLANLAHCACLITGICH